MKTRYDPTIAFSLLIILNVGTSQRPNYTLTPQQENRIFFWSDQAPLTKAINELAPETTPNIDLLLHHAARVENAIIKSLTERRAPKPDAVVKPCDPQISKAWRSSVTRSFGIRGFIQPVVDCGTDINGVSLEPNDEMGYTVDDLYDAAFNHNSAVKNRIKQIAARVTSNFTTPDVAFNFTYMTTSVTCSQTPVCLIRQHEYWYAKIGFHNVGKDTHAVDGQQVSILEYVRVVNGTLGDNPNMWLPVYDNGTVERVIRTDATTLIQRWSTNPNPSCFREIHMDENPAVLDALDQADHSAKQAEDAMTSSNLAILILPLGLNLIPIALVSDVSTITLLLYSLLSDTLTVIPLAIKGVELMLTGKTRWRSVVTRMTSHELGNGTKPIAAGGEIWAAECKVRDEVHKTGTILLVVSLTFFVIGISGEILAKRYVNRLEKRRAFRKWVDLNTDIDGAKPAKRKGDSILSSTGSISDVDYIGTSTEKLDRYSLSDGWQE